MVQRRSTVGVFVFAYFVKPIVNGLRRVIKQKTRLLCGSEICVVLGIAQQLVFVDLLGAVF